LRINSGRPVGQCPRSEGKSNRLRWLDLTVAKQADLDELVQVPEAHWFLQARNLGGLYIQMKKSARAERFLTYDLDVQTQLNTRPDSGPDQLKIANPGKHPVKDVLLIIPTADGKRVGWRETVAGAPNAPQGQPQPQPQRPQQPGNNPGGQPAQPAPPEI